jgi:mono/diheme cytochrome c family protein
VFLFLLTASIDLRGWSAAHADEPPAATPTAAGVDYLKHIKPVLKARCYACHGALAQKAGLRVDTAEQLLRGGDSGAVVTAGDPDGSELIRRLVSTDLTERMPPEGHPLTGEQIEQFRQWIAARTPAPGKETPEADPRAHWAFQPPVRFPLPTLPNRPPTHPVDAFLSHRLEAAGLPPRPPADRATLLRRVSLDLTGLPPTREELLDFLSDTSPDAYAKAVDRLLRSPHYGERWGRHWMDVWRYADWFGRRYVPDVWNSAPQIWRWRDWIVNSLNEDRGYDQMVAEMLAADELRPGDRHAAVATGYLIRNWYALNPNDWMRNTVEHTGKAFLGLTFNCAHCHDHKYDPIAQTDYFGLRAFFEPIAIRQDRLPGEADPGPFQEYNYSTLRKIQRLGMVSIYDKTPDAPTWLYTGGDERNRVKEKGSLPPTLPAFLKAQVPLQIQPIELPPPGYYPGLNPELQQTVRDDARRALAAAEQNLAQVKTLDTAVPAPLREELAAAEQALDKAKTEAVQTGNNGPLVGKQSLLFDATQGRRVLMNRLPGLKELRDGFTIEFQVRLLTPGHFNFQLAKHLIEGLTAGYVAFDQGRIMSYQPGTFTEFEAGRFNRDAGQDRFHVKLVLQTAGGQMLLSIRSLADNQLLVDAVPVATHGWNPVGDSTKGISFDARTGSVAAIDELILTQGPTAGQPGEVVAHFDFEPPAYAGGRDVVGLGSWEASSYGMAPATSLLTDVLQPSTLAPLEQRLAAARRQVHLPDLRLQTAESQVASAQAGLRAVEARIAADQARYLPTSGLSIEATSPKAQQAEREAALAAAQTAVLQAELALTTAEAKPSSDANRAKEIEAARTLQSTAAKGREAAEAALAQPLSMSYTPLSQTYPTSSTGRRAALARAIIDRRNPLTARVAVNHIWMRHFHQPLVSSVFDFGRNGTPPTHPELLDWLAVELMESGWSMKHLHRLLVTSEAYQRSSAVADSPAAKVDPENRLLWRMNVGRMEAEVVRDSLLAVSGRLDPTLGGQELENKDSLTTFRRSLYYCCQPEEDGKSQLGMLFDGPEPSDCYRRSRTIIPQQALALSNSDLAHDLSNQLAQKLWSSLSPVEQQGVAPFVLRAYQQILSRSPTPAELEACATFLAPTPGANPEANRAGLVRVLLNHNDFVAIR